MSPAKSGIDVINGDLSSGIENLLCFRCNEGFEVSEQIVNSAGQVWHSECFVYVYLTFNLSSIIIIFQLCTMFSTIS
jgi:hypothetical protein